MQEYCCNFKCISKAYIFSFLAIVKESYLTDKIIELEKKIKKLEGKIK